MLIEAVGKLGINLTSADTRIKHTGTGMMDISSNGSIYIKSGDGNDDNGGSIEIVGGIGGNNLNGGEIEITGGTGNDGENAYGGAVTIMGGHAKGNREGGNVYIGGGFGGDSSTGGNVTIEGGSGTGSANGADLILSGGSRGSVNTTRVGRVLCNTLFRVAVFGNDPERDAHQALPVKGDICFVESGENPVCTNKLQVWNGTSWTICN